MVSAINQTLASADKIHLVNLIATLKSELASTNELLNIKNAECKDVVVRLKCCDENLLAAENRIRILENKTVCSANRKKIIVKSFSKFIRFRCRSQT